MSEVISGANAEQVRENPSLVLKICPRSVRRLIRQFNRLSRRFQRILILSIIFFLVAFVALIWVEIRTSRFQAWYLSSLVKDLSFTLGSGQSRRIHFPSYGPYDIRLGYARIPKVTETMLERGFSVTSQAVMSERMFGLAQSGVAPTYQNKLQAGLVLKDRSAKTMYSVLRPERLYSQFDSIPKLVIEALLFIENKEVLDDRQPFKNPAVEWDRFFRASAENLYQIVDSSHSAPGGSTIATQLEKYRHSPEGRTHSVEDKLKQMLSASLRAYQNGPNTIGTRKAIVHNYINSIPLAAFPGYGEVNGVGDGLWAWYATDFNQCNQELSSYNPSKPQVTENLGLCFRKILSLFVAHRRPSYYLNKGRQELGLLVNSYLRLMAKEKAIAIPLADAALSSKVFFRGGTIEAPPSSFVDLKAVNAIRKGLSSLISIPKMYDLDQIDLTVQTSIDKQAHDEVTRTLQRLNDPQVAKELGLNQARLLSRGDPTKVTYSLTLFERTSHANLLRIQTDNFDGPFDINSGTRLDLGSTAKLRTLVTYLQVMQDLFNHLSVLTPKEREAQRTSKIDPIGNWAIDQLNRNPKQNLSQFLNASMGRTYSASPSESFFTGGGLHTFGNFRKEDNARIATISESLRESINLPFVRLMRDLVRFYSARLSTEAGKIQMTSTVREQAELRQAYLAKFADKEGNEFLRSFYSQYGGLKKGEFSEKLFKKLKPLSARYAAAHRFIFPDYSQAQFIEQFQKFPISKEVSITEIETLYSKYATEKFDLNDRGYIIKLHPLELWMVAYLEQHPEADLREVLKMSKEEKQIIYKWLFKPSKRRAQDARIKRLLEEDAFLPIYESWKSTGYPFASMVPSLASSIGSSGDRPAALAELMGIILNDGIRLPRSSIEKLHFGEDTPYETIFERKTNLKNENRVFSPEVAQVLRNALSDVVENGTARRLKGQFKLANGTVLTVGGKTGTGDHQFKTFAPGGGLLSAKTISRTATFVFFIDDRFFGAVSAHVKGEKAGEYEFTSALAAEVLKAASPALEQLIASPKDL